MGLVFTISLPECRYIAKGRIYNQIVKRETLPSPSLQSELYVKW